MSARLRNVFATYWRRPLVALLGTGSFLVLCILLLIPQVQTNRGIAPRLEMPQPWIMFGRDESALRVEDTAENIRTVRVDQGEIPDLSQFPGVRTVEVYTIPNRAIDLTPLGAAKDLTTLAFHDVASLTGDWGDLGTRIRQLHVTDEALVRHRDQFRDWNRLELLNLECHDLKPETLAAVREIPRLRTLVLNLGGRSDITPDDLATLNSHPTLYAVYGNWGPFFIEYEAAREALAPVRGVPSSYAYAKVHAFQMAMMLMAIATVIIGGQLWAHFISPQALVVPGYVASHRTVALLVLCVYGSLALAGFLRVSFPLFPGLVAVLWLPALAAMSVLLTTLRGDTVLRWLMVPTVFVAALSVSLGQAGLELAPAEFVTFTSGGMPILTSVFLSIEVLCLAGLLTRLPSLTRYANETSSVMPALSPWDLKQQERYHWSQAKGWQLWFLPAFNKGFQHHDGRFWKAVQLWRCGNPMRTRSVLVSMVVFVVCFEIALALISNRERSQYFTRTLDSQPRIMFATYSVMFCSIIPIGSWFRRRRSLESQFLWPIGRTQFANQLGMAIALDQWLGGLVAALILVISARQGGPVISLAVAIVGGLLWIYAVSLATFAFRETWRIVLVDMVGFYVAILLGLGTVYVIASDYPRQWSATQLDTVLSGVGIVLIATGACSIYLMRRQILRREWG